MCIRDRYRGMAVPLYCCMGVNYGQQESRIQGSDIAFLLGVKKCSKPDNIRNVVIREELQVFNLHETLKDYKRRWKEHLERMPDLSVWKYINL